MSRASRATSSPRHRRGKHWAPDDPTPIGRTVCYAVLGVWAFVVLFPLYWVLVTSFKLPIDVNNGPFYVPFIDFQPNLHAWRYLFVDVLHDTLRPYMNTVIVALISSVIALIVGSTAAYALVRISYRPRLGSVGLFVICVVVAIVAVVALGVPWLLAVAVGLGLFAMLLLTVARRFRKRLKNDDIAFWMVSQRILPPVTVVIPIYVVFQHLGLLDTRTALIITYVIANVPIVIWLMRDFFLSVPHELEESAMTDGATRYRIFWSIVLPLSVPGLAATGILVLIMAWNEYLFALFLTSANSQTLPLLVAAQNATRGPQWWTMSVLILVMIVPVTVLAMLLERFIMRGLLIGALKG